MATTICPTCSCTEIDVVDVSGEAVCVSCGTILEENNIVSSVEFQESGGGAHSVVGQFVSATASKAYGNIGTSGRNYGIESRANTLANGKKKIRQIAGMLRLGDHYVDSAFRLFALALQRNFTHGRKTQTVIAACLYIVCRRERSPHLLIDFSDKLQINVYVLGGVFLKFCKLLQIHLPLIDPSLYIHRFASQLNFAGKTHSIATTALRLVATMKRDWIETGRRPSGICGAALLIAARSQSVMCSLHDVMDVVNIGERTLKQRLYEFSLTPTAQLTYDQVGKLEMSRVECDPPSFQRHREKEVMEMLLLESEKLPLEQKGQKRLARGRRDSDEESDEDDESGGALAKGMLNKKAQRLKDEEMSRFLSGDAYYKKKQAEALLGSNGTIIVNRASRLAAQEVLLRVRKKSARYIMRKREEASFYKTIERDLTMALEEDTSARAKRSGGNKQEDEINGDTEHSTSPTTSADDEAVSTVIRRRRSRDLADSTVDTFSDLDDDEINSLLLTREEAEKKKLLWEKMNKDYIQEQEQKRLLGLSAPDAPKKKRRKKTPDVNAPPPDTAQHAIYKLKSRRINYEVIDELFGEAASNGF
ncbi:transcription factor IIIB, putative [Phytophthora infestans T30-4]|uniref:B-related factor 1 n=1 Tax=Phytophthora infestans (strain T30-4) TaxID=403677 RepID=D0NVC1_PHYIT|nr:transcription factor IIIB, putative [Phytophthora infestans T30-4]EEY66598.1 transcription factor IIIB, putative [Phytophthora infestans T30-4]|eukprot:XP_002896899.1 transcription factor IIIB, putative [Phytophthora infestans T30-4]